MENNLIVKSNELIEARFNLTLNEQKLFLYAVSQLDKDLLEFTSITVNIRDFTNLVDTTEKRYEEIRDIARGLREKEVLINRDNKQVSMGGFSKVKAEERTGDIEIFFDNDMMPYLLQLKKRFTRYQLKNILYMKNKYSIRVYELLKQYEKIGSRSFELLKLKKVLALEKGQYIRIYDFERFVLKPSMEEINELTDINVSYEKVKKGRKVVGIEYTISSKDDKSYIKYLNETYDIADFKIKSGLANENFDSKQIIELFTIATEVLTDPDQQDIFEYIKLNYLHMLKNKTIVNKYAYLKKALNEDYAAARGQIKLNYSL